MPVKRRLHKGRAHRITDDALEAWRIGDFHALNRALDIRPWMVSPFDADGPEPPEWARGKGDVWGESWPLGWELRCELLKSGPPGHVGRHGEPEGPA
jgi:hypothetical protein